MDYTPSAIHQRSGAHASEAARRVTSRGVTTARARLLRRRARGRKQLKGGRVEPMRSLGSGDRPARPRTASTSRWSNGLTPLGGRERSWASCSMPSPRPVRRGTGDIRRGRARDRKVTAAPRARRRVGAAGELARRPLASRSGRRMAFSSLVGPGPRAGSASRRVTRARPSPLKLEQGVAQIGQDLGICLSRRRGPVRPGDDRVRAPSDAAPRASRGRRQQGPETTGDAAEVRPDPARPPARASR